MRSPAALPSAITGKSSCRPAPWRQRLICPHPPHASDEACRNHSPARMRIGRTRVPCAYAYFASLLLIVRLRDLVPIPSGRVAPCDWHYSRRYEARIGLPLNLGLVPAPLGQRLVQMPHFSSPGSSRNRNRAVVRCGVASQFFVTGAGVREGRQLRRSVPRPIMSKRANSASSAPIVPPPPPPPALACCVTV